MRGVDLHLPAIQRSKIRLQYHRLSRLSWSGSRAWSGNILLADFFSPSASLTSSWLLSLDLRSRVSPLLHPFRHGICTWLDTEAKLSIYFCPSRQARFSQLPHKYRSFSIFPLRSHSISSLLRCHISDREFPDRLRVCLGSLSSRNNCRIWINHDTHCVHAHARCLVWHISCQFDHRNINWFVRYGLLDRVVSLDSEKQTHKKLRTALLVLAVVLFTLVAVFNVLAVMAVPPFLRFATLLYYAMGTQTGSPLERWLLVGINATVLVIFAIFSLVRGRNFWRLKTSSPSKFNRILNRNARCLMGIIASFFIYVTVTVVFIIARKGNFESICTNYLRIFLSFLALFPSDLLQLSQYIPLSFQRIHYFLLLLRICPAIYLPTEKTAFLWLFDEFHRIESCFQIESWSAFSSQN